MFISSLFSVFCILGAADAGHTVAESHQLHYTEPALTWDEALPLGNGILGALVWGDGTPLNISLDRTDLWDLRPVPEYHSEDYTYTKMRAWEKAGKIKELLELYDNPYHRPAPTKIPAGRIELHFSEGTPFIDSMLNLQKAQCFTDLGGAALLRIWVHAEQPIGEIYYFGRNAVTPSLIAPAFGGMEEGPAKPAISMGDLAQLGYPDPVETQGENWRAYTQEGWGGFSFAVYLEWKPLKDNTGWRAFWSVASSKEGDDPLAIAKQRVQKAHNESIDTLQASHLDWWSNYWDQSWVKVPHESIEHQWYMDTYKFGAAGRRDAPPITLQGPWTADDGKLPPWKGDYHHDLNTELSYWPCYSGNRLDAGLGFLDWLWDTRPACEDWTQRFFEMPGMNVPMTADLNNNQIGGWRQYTHSSTTACWLAHHFYLHWKYSADDEFLKKRGYPYLKACATFIEAVTNERDDAGLRTLPLSSSPEINDNRPSAWFPTITNYDLALIRWLMSASAEMAETLGKEEDVKHWRMILDELPVLAVDKKGALLVAKDFPLKASHRHFSHLMAIHPLGLVDVSYGETETRIINASLKQLDKLGSDYWTGYSFSWLANMQARAKDGEAAAKSLEIFAENFVLRNSFHCNGEQQGKGFSKFTYRPFTLEGNFAYAAGLQEMLLQSHTGVIEVFPAIPDTWQDIEFHQLRAQGAYLVSATMKEGAITRLTVTAEKDGHCLLQLPGPENRIGFDIKASEQRIVVE